MCKKKKMGACPGGNQWENVWNMAMHNSLPMIIMNYLNIKKSIGMQIGEKLGNLLWAILC